MWHTNRVPLLNPQLRSRPRARTRRPLSRASARGHLKALKAFGAWLARDGYLRRNPLAALAVPKADLRLFPVFSDEQLDAVLRCAADDRRRGRLWTAVLWLFIDTGLRLGELAGAGGRTG